ncbi:MAG: hypothetical protein PHQ47_02770 [Candidatus Portnoybacteria bacterium]|nr:hypothetical protein [Candidatus Portnoybacteria bacterium]
MSTLTKDMDKGVLIQEMMLHNNFSREIRPPQNLVEWFELWQEAKTSKQMLGLLHCIFEMPLEKREYAEKKFDGTDRLIFCFAIADGWCNDNLLTLSGDRKTNYRVYNPERGNWEDKRPSEIRREVALKAFTVLAQNFFKTELKESRVRSFLPVWEEVIVSENLFPVIQDFFRAESERLGSQTVEIRNLSYRNEKRPHYEESAVGFLLNLAEFIWEWQEIKIETWYEAERQEKIRSYNARTRSRLDSAKPWTIEVLSKLDRFDVLRPEQRLLSFDKACLAKLEEIALRNELWPGSSPVLKKRKVATINEACYIGSAAGWLLKEYELKMKEHKRLKAIMEAEEKKEEAERALQKLRG